MTVTVFQAPTGQQNYTPIAQSINAEDATLTQILTPGFVNSSASIGTINPNNLLIIKYQNGTDIFRQTIVDGVVHLSIAFPNSNGFPFQNLQFVAKGGSDLNVGNTLGSPKLTIQAAINALNLSSSQSGVVWVLDGESYDEQLTTTYGFQLYAPTASIVSNGGDLLTINDSGENTLTSITCAQFAKFSPGGLALNLLGAQSNVFLNSKIVQGDMYVEGGFIDGNIAQVASNVHVASTGMFGPTIINKIFFTLTVDTGGTVFGNIGSIVPGDASNIFYGQQTFINKLIFQSNELSETTGRTVSAADSNSTIQYTNLTATQYILPATINVNIPIGTIIRFVQLGNGAIQFSDDGASSVISYVGGPCQTNGLNSKATAEKLNDVVWLVDGNIANSP